MMLRTKKPVVTPITRLHIIFVRIIEMRPAESEYTFYDGPPFAPGSPHYGHILQGVVKDIVPRYWTMRGHRVERRFGWDTHGLPVEMEVQKRLGVSSPREIEDLGVDRFNQAARDLVSDINDQYSGDHGKDLFKATNKTAKALTRLC